MFRKIPFGRLIPHFPSKFQNLTVFQLFTLFEIDFSGRGNWGVVDSKVLLNCRWGLFLQWISQQSTPLFRSGANECRRCTKVSLVSTSTFLSMMLPRWCSTILLIWLKQRASVMRPTAYRTNICDETAFILGNLGLHDTLQSARVQVTQEERKPMGLFGLVISSGFDRIDTDFGRKHTFNDYL